jgi:hypothetical protein
MTKQQKGEGIRNRDDDVRQVVGLTNPEHVEPELEGVGE